MSRRRTKKRAPVLCAIAASVLLVPVVAAVVASPAHAANTAAEFLIDTNDDEVPDSRPFAGRHRYETAVLLAEQYAQARGGLRSVSTVIIVSGESSADGAVVAGLAGYLGAPILLTPQDELASLVARYIDEHAVQRVVVVGGSLAVSEVVLQKLAALDSAPIVERIAGDDRFGTAAAVASELGAEATWCGSNETVVVLANGSDAAASLALSAGPLAYGLELPILLTDTHELPKATSSFLIEHEIDRVLVMGGTRAVSQQIVSSLTELGVTATTRYSGNTSDVTSAAIARQIRGTCKDILGSTDGVAALVSRYAPFDAMAAIPVAGEGLDGSGPMPLVMVGETLPSSARSILASTPVTVDGLKNHLRVVAVGGTAAVSDAVMAAAVRAGGGARVLSARIRTTAGRSGFSVIFGDRIDGEIDDLTDVAKDMFYVNDVPASIPVGGVEVPADDSCDAPKELSVALTHPLMAGDVVEMRPTDIKLGILGDLRPVATTRYMVPTPRTDTRAPTVELIAPAGSSNLRIIARDNEEASGISIDPGEIRVVSSRKVTVRVEDSGTTAVDPYFRFATRSVALIAPDGYNANPREDSDFDDAGEIAPGDPYPLAAGDALQLGSGVASDAEDNRSRPRRTRIASTKASFAVSAVRLGSPDPGVDHNPDNAVPDRIEGVSHRVETFLAGVLRIAAKWTGDAEGAAGNGWSINVGRVSDYNPDAKEVEVEVAVNTRNRIVTIRFVSGTPTYGELVDELNNNRSFSSRFEAEATGGCDVRPDPVDVNHADFDGTTEFEGGLTTVALLVQFNAPVRDFVSENATYVADGDEVYELVDDVLSSLITDFTTVPEAEIAGDRVIVQELAPYPSVFVRFTTADGSRVPSTSSGSRRGVIDIDAGIAHSFHPDNPDTELDEGLNAAKSLRSSRSRLAELTQNDPVAP